MNFQPPSNAASFMPEKTRLGQFEWRYLESGPAQWHVRIARVAAGQPGGDTGG